MRYVSSAGAQEASLDERFELIRELGSRKTPTFLARMRDAEGQRLVVVEQFSRAALGEAPIEPLVAAPKALAEVRHTNLARVREFRVEPEVIVTVTDFVDGALWSELVGQGTKLPAPVALRVFSDICTALVALRATRGPGGQAMPMAHGEVVGSNILVGLDGNARLLRACRLRPELPGSGSCLEAAALPSGFESLAPEVLEGRPADGRSDVYSIGVLLWGALSGEVLFQGAEPSAILGRLRLRDIPPPRVSPEEAWAAPLADIIGRAISLEPEKRPPSAVMMGTEIRKVAGGRLATVAIVGAVVKGAAGAKIKARRAVLDSGFPPPLEGAPPAPVPKREPTPPPTAAKPLAPPLHVPPAGERKPPAPKPPVPVRAPPPVPPTVRKAPPLPSRAQPPEPAAAAPPPPPADAPLEHPASPAAPTPVASSAMPESPPVPAASSALPERPPPIAVASPALPESPPIPVASSSVPESPPVPVSIFDAPPPLPAEPAPTPPPHSPTEVSAADTPPPLPRPLAPSTKPAPEPPSTFDRERETDPSVVARTREQVARRRKAMIAVGVVCLAAAVIAVWGFAKRTTSSESGESVTLTKPPEQPPPPPSGAPPTVESPPVPAESVTVPPPPADTGIAAAPTTEPPPEPTTSAPPAKTATPVKPAVAQPPAPASPTKTAPTKRPPPPAKSKYGFDPTKI